MISRFMNYPVLFLGLAFLLGSCAPTQSGPLIGRIVSATTGIEGEVSIVRGTLYNRPEGVNASENVMITLGKQVLTGRTVLVDTGITTVTQNWTGNTWPYRPWSMTGRPFVYNEVVSRSGNLIARSRKGDLIITCQLLVNTNEHGTGECQGSDKNSYTVQF